jgi:hypothetical protein
VVSGSWWFAVISVPLTIITFLIWKYWLLSSIREQERKQAAEINPEKVGGGVESLSTGYGKLSRNWVGNYMLALRNRRREPLSDEA